MSIIFPNTGLTPNVSTYTLDTRTWIWTGQAWKLTTTTVVGPTGPTGSTGATGPTGPGAVTMDYGLITGTVDSSTDYGSI